MYGAHCYWQTVYSESGRMREMYGRALPQLHQARILDIGCATGQSTEELAKRYWDCDVLGIDIDQKSIKKAQRSLFGKRARYMVADGYKSEFPNASFDMVLCNNNLSYVAEDMKDELFPILQGIMRLIKPLGYFAVATGTAFTGEPIYDHLILQVPSLSVISKTKNLGFNTARLDIIQQGLEALVNNTQLDLAVLSRRVRDLRPMQSSFREE